MSSRALIVVAHGRSTALLIDADDGAHAWLDAMHGVETPFSLEGAGIDHDRIEDGVHVVELDLVDDGPGDAPGSRETILSVRSTRPADEEEWGSFLDDEWPWEQLNPDREMVVESIDADPGPQAAVVLVVRAGAPGPEVLVVTNRKYGGVSLPGGKVEPGELPKEAARRELAEEVGIVAHDLSHVCRYVNTLGTDSRQVTVFHAALVIGEPQQVEDGTVPMWISWEDLLAMSPFRRFYEDHFPDGVAHLRATRIDPG